jgi:ubiquinone/menaquinone biosynthesis C-methylase UbiE
MDNFEKKSYARHETHFESYTKGKEREEHARTWFNNDTIDAWRHKRMYKTIDPILAFYPDSSWLTVGDGRYGKDAHYIVTHGCKCLATDISESLLKEAKEMGYIQEYKKENAENLSFADEEFDFVFCKEAFHHFPRPMIALYQMLRVSKKGVILIEPNDLDINAGFLYQIFQKIIKFRHPTKPSYEGISMVEGAYEDVGNCVYFISKREIIKVALSLNLRMVAFKGLNDFYEPNVEYEKVTETSKIYLRVKKTVERKDILSSLKIVPYGILTTIIFKTSPEKDVINRLLKTGYEVIELSQNTKI